MIQLKIRNADGTTYWIEHFNSQADAEKWLAEEKTRSYWVATRTHELIDLTPVPPTKEEKAIKEAKEKIKKDRADLLEIIDPKNPAETIAAFKLLRDHVLGK